MVSLSQQNVQCFSWRVHLVTAWRVTAEYKPSWSALHQLDAENLTRKPEHRDDLGSSALKHKASIIKDLIQLSLPPLHVSFLHKGRLNIGNELSKGLSHEHWTPQRPRMSSSKTRLEFDKPGSIFVTKYSSSRKRDSRKGDHHGRLK